MALTPPPIWQAPDTLPQHAGPISRVLFHLKREGPPHYLPRLGLYYPAGLLFEEARTDGIGGRHKAADVALWCPIPEVRPHFADGSQIITAADLEGLGFHGTGGALLCLIQRQDRFDALPDLDGSYTRLEIRQQGARVCLNVRTLDQWRFLITSHAEGH